MFTNDKSDNIERRKFVRVPKEFVVSFKELVMDKNAEKKFVSKSKNLSADGIRIESSTIFPVGTLLKLELQIQRWEKFSAEYFKFDQTSISKPFVAIGTVVWVEEKKQEDSVLGIMLKNVDESHGEALKRYLESLMV